MRIPAPALTRLANAANGRPRQALAVLLLLSGAALLVAHPARSSANLTDVVVAADQLQAGAVLRADDLRTARWPADLVPDEALRSASAALGKPVAGPMAAGEALTATRLLDTAISSALLPGQVAVTIALRDRSQTAILQAGARIDLYAAPPAGSAGGEPTAAEAGPVASDVKILAVLAPTAAVRDAATSSDSASVVIACPQATASQLARASPEMFVASLRPIE